MRLVSVLVVVLFCVPLMAPIFRGQYDSYAFLTQRAKGVAVIRIEHPMAWIDGELRDPVPGEYDPRFGTYSGTELPYRVKVIHSLKGDVGSTTALSLDMVGGWGGMDAQYLEDPAFASLGSGRDAPEKGKYYLVFLHDNNVARTKLLETYRQPGAMIELSEEVARRKRDPEAKVYDRVLAILREELAAREKRE
jgi:hypothetical protein